MGPLDSVLAEARKDNAAEDVHEVWRPQPGSQIAFLECPVFECLLEGPRGGGKTDTLLMDYVQDVGQGYGPDWRGILFRQTYPQLQDVIAKSKKWFNQIGLGAVYNEGQHFWKFRDGEILFFRQFMRDSDYWNFHGHEYPWQGWEELCNWPTLTGYKQMMSTCRSSNPAVASIARIRSTTNPYGPGHNVVKHRFRLPAFRNRPILDSVDEEDRPEPPRQSIFSHFRENRALLDADPNYISRIVASARNEAERKAWIDGSWDIVAGGMFDDVWEPKTHVLRPFPIPASWRIDRSFDWGSSAPFSVGWWAESDGSDVQLADGRVVSTVRGDLFRVDEWYGWNGKPNEGLRMTATEIAHGIIERELKHGWRDGDRLRVRSGPADTSIYDVENGHCIADDMARRQRVNGRVHPGVTFQRADKRPGSRKTGWEQVRTMLQGGKRKEGRPRERPGLFIFDTCDQFIRTFPVLPRSEKDMDDVDTATEDHIADETRYRVRANGNRVEQRRVTGGH